MAQRETTYNELDGILAEISSYLRKEIAKGRAYSDISSDDEYQAMCLREKAVILKGKKEDLEDLKDLSLPEPYGNNVVSLWG